jgi:hypothetical protein
MTKFQKVIYKTAKVICKNNICKDVLTCYKSRLKTSKENKYSFKYIQNEYKEQLKWKNWFTTYDWSWNEEKGHAEWINKTTKVVATQEDCDNFWK